MVGGGKAGAIIADFEQQATRLLPYPHAGRRSGTCMFGGILKPFKAAEIHRRLHLWGMPADAVRLDAGRKRRIPTCGTHGHTEPRAGEQRRADSMRRRTELLGGRTDVILELVHERPRSFGVAFR